MPLAERPVHPSHLAFTRSSHWRPPQLYEALPAQPQPSSGSIEDPRATSSSSVRSSHTPRLPHRLVHHPTPNGAARRRNAI
jgi:hypothetical protein